jgi:hypothetical protein
MRHAGASQGAPDRGNIEMEMPDPCRIAIAALDLPDGLQNALCELGSNSFPASALCLAGSPAALEKAHSAIAALPAPVCEFASLAREVEPLTVDSIGVPMLATSDRLLTRLKGTVTDRLVDPGGRCWLLPQLRRGLFERIGEGDVMLLAGPLGSAREMTLGTRILLRYSRHPVQSHEFARPRA